jgi:invasion protein IalB
VLVSAAVRQIDGQDKQHFMIMVPLGMLIQPGMRASIYPKDQWDLVQKNEKVDEAKLKGIKLGYTLCHPAGCTAEVEATPELIGDLRGSGGLVVFAINASGQPVGFPVPLDGFAEAYAGPPTDNQKYKTARQALIEQIKQRAQQQQK